MAHRRSGKTATLPYPEGFRIEYPELMNLDALRQAIFEDIAELEARGVEYVEKAQLFVPCCNQYGDRVTVRDENGRKPRFWTSHAYKSAAWDYDL